MNTLSVNTSYYDIVNHLEREVRSVIKSEKRVLLCTIWTTKVKNYNVFYLFFNQFLILNLKNYTNSSGSRPE
jgi:hypothetical protein